MAAVAARPLPVYRPGICRLAFSAIWPLTALWPEVGRADDTGVQTVDEIVVFGRVQEQVGSATSASEGLVGYDDLRLAPLLRVGELVETVPMVATQHSGTGKANQYSCAVSTSITAPTLRRARPACRWIRVHTATGTAIST